MASVDPTSVIILAEIATLQAIIIVATITIYIIKKRKKSLLLSKTLKRLEEGRQKRKELIEKSFCGINNITNEKMHKISDSIIESEALFYSNVINAFFSNNTAIINEIDTHVEELTLPYKEFATNPASENTEVVNEDDTTLDVDDAINELLSDNSENPADPALDLSTNNTNEKNEDVIAEIPDDLLSDTELTPDPGIDSVPTKDAVQ